MFTAACEFMCSLFDADVVGAEVDKPGTRSGNNLVESRVNEHVDAVGSHTRLASDTADAQGMQGGHDGDARHAYMQTDVSQTCDDRCVKTDKGHILAVSCASNALSSEATSANVLPSASKHSV